jgi:hypothetical protein
MISISIKLDSAKLNAKLVKQQKALARLPTDALNEFKDLTPIKTGNARSHTGLSGDKSKIIGAYPYAKRLDSGSSKQAPSGMTRPFAAWFKRELKKIIGK